MFSDNFRASIYLSASMAGYTINDAFIKSIDHSINLGQVLLVRGLMASLLLLMLARHYGVLGKPFSLFNRMLSLRTVCELLATLAFLTALKYLPLANIAAIMQALPLVVTLGAVLFFNERVGRHRWFAIVLGLMGVLLIIRPGMQGFSVYSLLVLAVVIFAAARDLFTRSLPVEIPSLLVSLFSAIVITLMGLFLLLPMGGWQPMSALIWLKLAGAAIAILMGYQCIVLAVRIGDMSSIAPFRYSGLLWAVALGYFVFGETLDYVTITGSTIVVVAGLYALYRERLAASS